MPERSTRLRPARPELSPAHAEFASALDAAVKSLGLAQYRIAAKSGIPATTLSGYLCGRRLPKTREALDLVCVTMEKHAQAAKRSLPYSRAELHRLFELALRERWDTRVGSVAGRGEPTPAAQEQPASRPTYPRRRLQRRVRLYGGRRKVPHSAARTAVPVPQGKGDRHRTEAVSTAPWAVEAEEIRRHFTEGRDWDAYLMLRNAASTVPAHEFPGVVSSCRAAGLEQAVETLLKTAAEREVRAVLSITAALHEQRQYEDAGVMLAAARGSL